MYEKKERKKTKKPDHHDHDHMSVEHLMKKKKATVES